MIGIFARANHPKGYGYPDGHAHGYVVLLVKCSDDDELEAVCKALNDYKKPFHGLDRVNSYGWKTYDVGWLGEWYGGHFDLVAVVNTEDNPNLTYWWNRNVPTEGRYQSKGDNRFVGIYEAKDILDEQH